jgi:2-oxoglutarate ferredoxin oxidoreductase subunit alpha
VEKRRRKELALRSEVLAPKLRGSDEASIAVVAWGATEPIVTETLRRLDDPRVAHIHFVQLYPLGEDIAELLGAYEKRILVEDSPTGAFGDLLMKECGIEMHDRILKDDGIAFYVEELLEALRELVS